MGQVHRGHSVFDTCEVVRGHLYCLDEHFKRFLNSAALAGIQLSMTQAQMYRAILETAAASEKMDCESPSWVRSCMPVWRPHPAAQRSACARQSDDPAPLRWAVEV